jgi:thiamine-monophosphate kinase
LSEESRLERLRILFGAAKAAAGVLVGIGDDAAVLAEGRAPLVWTVDAAVEGVHFRREWMSFEDIGWRSLMAAASDLAAMGATPRGIVCALVLPDDFGDDDLEALARGQASAARAIGTSVVGGNLARGSELSITTSVIGEASRPLLRSGAKPSQVAALAGPVGLSRAGLEALTRGLGDKVLDPALEAYRRPRARIEEGLAAAPFARAAIDVSDGLALDASRLAKESGVGVVIDAEKLLGAAGDPLSSAARVLSLDPLELALFGGEDFALFASFDQGAIATGFVPIGRFVAERGLWLELADGTKKAIEPRGFDHFQ